MVQDKSNEYVKLTKKSVLNKDNNCKEKRDETSGLKRFKNNSDAKDSELLKSDSGKQIESNSQDNRRNKIVSSEKSSNIKNDVKGLTDYLNSIDFSMVSDVLVLDNIYSEILPKSTELTKDPHCCSSLERLLCLSSSSHLIQFLESLDRSSIYKKLGSRIVECIYRRLFELMYQSREKKEEFSLERVIEFINFENAMTCQNATFVVRQALMLLSGKKIDKLKVDKFKVNSTKKYPITKFKISKNEDSDPNNTDDIGMIDNLSYSKIKLDKIKEIFKTKLPSFESNDQFNTLGCFLQISKSQSLIKMLLEKDLNEESIVSREFLYEAVASIANTANMDIIFRVLKNCDFVELSKKASYFLRSFIRHFKYPSQIYNKIYLDEYDQESNVILALLESFIRNGEYNKSTDLLVNFYKVKENHKSSKDKNASSLFYQFLFQKYGSFDSKYADLICLLMAAPREHNFGVNDDFVKYFNKEWLKNKTGISITVAFAQGSADRRFKQRFFDENVDLFWVSLKWAKAKVFLNILTDLLTGFSKKKVHDMLKKIE